MRDDDKTESRSLDITRYALILALIWTGGVVASLAWNISQFKKSILRIARTSAEISYDKDIVYRRWVALQGGVYVAVSELTPSNPYLTVPDRDVTTTDGLHLTLVNPAYMNRQVNELAAEMRNLQGHLTSLNPIRPENYPDPWEREALKSFEQGARETSALAMISGKEHFRFMRPFVTEKPCLKCHASQGYKEGDIRGGISIAIPMEPLRAIERSHTVEVTLAHSLLWVIGLVGIGMGTKRLRHQSLQRAKAEDELRALSITDQLTGVYNRRGFLTLAEGLLKLSNRSKRGLQLFFADLDGMKLINDTRGHQEGDNALVEATTVLKETVRSSDIIARMGGDEFAVLAIDAQEATSEPFMSRLLDRIDRRNRQENRKYRLALSVGYAYYDPANPCSLDELIAQADNMMYAQKKAKGVQR